MNLRTCAIAVPRGRGGHGRAGAQRKLTCISLSPFPRKLPRRAAENAAISSLNLALSGQSLPSHRSQSRDRSGQRRKPVRPAQSFRCFAARSLQKISGRRGPIGIIPGGVSRRAPSRPLGPGLSARVSDQQRRSRWRQAAARGSSTPQAGAAGTTLACLVANRGCGSDGVVQEGSECRFCCFVRLSISR